jgi:alkanesulfonate monooxygenase SsuD/methylene tetrahydromethanopterin reductase-like flavin-dependent oxidoreductase (luciferase family)
VFVAVRLGTLEELEPNITAYRKAWKEAGHPGEGKVFLRAPVYLADTDKAALEEPEESIMYFYRYLGERLEDSATRARRGPRPPWRRRLQEITYEDALREKIIVGSPERVTDRLMGLQEKLGLDGILCEMNCGTKIPHDRVMKSLQLLCERVSPRFNWGRYAGRPGAKTAGTIVISGSRPAYRPACRRLYRPKLHDRSFVAAHQPKFSIHQWPVRVGAACVH